MARNSFIRAMESGDNFEAVLNVCAAGTEAVCVAISPLAPQDQGDPVAAVREFISPIITDIDNKSVKPMGLTRVLVLAAVRMFTAIYDDFTNYAVLYLNEAFMLPWRRESVVMSVVREYFAKTGKWLQVASDEDVAMDYLEHLMACRVPDNREEEEVND